MNSQPQSPLDDTGPADLSLNFPHRVVVRINREGTCTVLIMKKTGTKKLYTYKKLRVAYMDSPIDFLLTTTLGDMIQGHSRSR